MASFDAHSFMEEVRKYPCLYNKYDKEYKNEYIKVNCWKRIAEKFDIDAQLADQKFKSLRTAYGRFLKRKKSVRSGCGRESVPVVPREFINLGWLQGHMSFRANTASNFDVHIEREEEDENESISIDSAESCLEVSEISSDKHSADSSINIDDIEESIYDNTLECFAEEMASKSTTESPKEDENKKNETPVQKPASTRPWSKYNKKKTKELDEVDKAFINSCQYFANHIKRAEGDEKETVKEPECEDSLFCNSLVARMRRLDQHSKAFIRMSIEQLFFQVESSKHAAQDNSTIMNDVNQNTQRRYSAENGYTYVNLN